MFTFKQFTIDDSACAMKVGTDGVLLGAWAPTGNACRILDVGTGSGLIALMLAQRNNLAKIDAIDIDGDAVRQAEQNAATSPFHKRIKMWQTDYATMQEEAKYDLIVSNPPFYKEDTLCPDSQRDAARHTASLPFEALISKTSRLLSSGGTFAVIIPTANVTDFIGTCATHRLYMSHRTDIHTTLRKPAKRTLLSFTDSIDQSASIDKLFMRDGTNSLSEEYKVLTKDFYLD